MENEPFLTFETIERRIPEHKDLRLWFFLCQGADEVHQVPALFLSQHRAAGHDARNTFGNFPEDFAV